MPSCNMLSIISDTLKLGDMLTYASLDLSECNTSTEGRLKQSNICENTRHQVIYKSSNKQLKCRCPEDIPAVDPHILAPSILTLRAVLGLLSIQDGVNLSLDLCMALVDLLATFVL